MKSEYDFKNAQRGKFFRKDASLELPVWKPASAPTSPSAQGEGRPRQ